MKAHTYSAATFEACLRYAHAMLLHDSDARLFWYLHQSLGETLAREHPALLAHLVAARDQVVALLVTRGKVEE